MAPPPSPYASPLVATRSAVVGVVANHLAGLGADVVRYEMDPSELVVPGATQTVADVRFVLPTRRLIAFDGWPMIRQTGALEVEWSFPGAIALQGFVDMTRALHGTAQLLREQSLAGGVRLFGDAVISRRESSVNQSSARLQRAATGRIVWVVRVEWERVGREVMHGDAAPAAPLAANGIEASLLAVRNVWKRWIETAEPLAGWAGLPTRWDQLPDLPTAPALPWAGYWIDLVPGAGREVDQTIQQVAGRALVMVQSDPYEGSTPYLTRLDRIIEQHNRNQAGVSIGPVDIEATTRTPAATLQTNLRIPFAFDQIRAT